MLNTWLTREWGLRFPLIGAPMAGVAFGALAAAVSRAGGIGTIGVGSTETIERLAAEATIASQKGTLRFGIGLMEWAVRRRPELLEAALAARPFFIALSFGDIAPYVARIHDAGVRLATQVSTLDDALAAERAGADLVVVQGTEAGGHSGAVATLTLLQIVLERVRAPVAAAGGIATARGVAAVLAAGAEGAWIGTPLLVAREAASSPDARARLIAAREDETVQTHLFDRLLGIPWPDRYPGRALVNEFTERWHGREDAALADADAVASYRAARERGDHSIVQIYAGQSVGLIERERDAAEIIAELGDGAETLLRMRGRELLAGDGA